MAVYRSYNSILGQWLKRDPIGEIDSTNLYVFSKNDPVNFTDPLGLKAYKCCNQGDCCDDNVQQCINAGRDQYCCHRVGIACHLAVEKGRKFPNFAWATCRKKKTKKINRDKSNKDNEKNKNSKNTKIPDSNSPKSSENHFPWPTIDTPFGPMPTVPTFPVPSVPVIPVIP